MLQVRAQLQDAWRVIRTNYRLTEKDGTMHLLMGEAVALDRHVGHIVELVGYKDNDRNASASSDEVPRMGCAFSW